MKLGRWDAQHAKGGAIAALKCLPLGRGVDGISHVPGRIAVEAGSINDLKLLIADCDRRGEIIARSTPNRRYERAVRHALMLGITYAVLIDECVEQATFADVRRADERHLHQLERRMARLHLLLHFIEQ